MDTDITDENKIQKLPAEARSKLQSGIIITDAVQCVLELVYNSLDAEATGVAVRIDLKNYQIRVIDNGKGISRSDLELVGERFMTSKYCFNNLNSSISTYGYKGQAISSLLDACGSVIIETKSNVDSASYVKVFQNKMALPITKSLNERNGTGTTVTVEDFMCTMPVRRKRINEVFDIEEIKTQLQHLAIIHYSVAFTLRNENKGLILLQTHQTTSTLLSIASIFGKTVAKSLIPLNYKEKEYEISGFISMRPQRHNLQLLYINKRKVKKGVIHKLVNDLMIKYFLQEELSTDSSLDQGFRLRNLRHGSHNVFILMIACPHSYYELFPSMGKSEIEFKDRKEVLKYVCNAVKKALRFDDDSSNSPAKLKKIDNRAEEDDEPKTEFGTSLLLNAVRGFAAKREPGVTKDIKKRKKKKGDNDLEKFVVSLLKAGDKKDFERNLTTVHSNQDTNHEADINCTNDSLESPIPKKCLKLFQQGKPKSDSNTLEISRKSLNESFLQFYEWLKEKFETDPSTFNFYNDFLLYKQGNSDLKINDFDKREISERKLQRKNLFSSIKRFSSRRREEDKRILISKCVIPEDKITNTKAPRKQLEAFPDDCLKNKESVRFLRRNDVRRFDDSKNFDISFGNISNVKLSKRTNEWKPEEWVEPHILSKKRHIMKVYQTVPSPALSEVVFTNFIKFRNFPENFDLQSSHVEKETFPDKQTNSVSNTWMSHYRDQIFTNIAVDRDKRQEDYVFPFGEDCHQQQVYFENPNSRNRASLQLDIESYEFQNDYLKSRQFEKAANTLRYQDAEIQTDLSGKVVPAKKVDAMVQTSISNNSLDETHMSNPHSYPVISESPSFENHNTGKTLGKRVLEFPEADQNVSHIEDDEIQNCQTANSEFCGIHRPEANVALDDGNDFVFLTNQNPNPPPRTKNNSKIDFIPIEAVSSTSGLLCCAQKSDETVKNQDDSGLSKETETLAAMWKDCLADIGSAAENTNSNNFVQSSVNNQKSGSTQLTKTIPIEELDLNFSSVPGPLFSVSERHDIIPKGLSPACLKTGNSKILSSLSPHEKSRIKLTIDNTENELLASVKWQDESTGGSTKPTILDGILDEMRQKAEKNMIYYENEILSASLSYCAIKVHNLLHSFAFTKELLSSVEILGQLDKKFIVAKMKVCAPKKMELISVFDQHAVDERIKLEELINDYIGPDKKFISTSLNPSTECVLNESAVRIISNEMDSLLNYGLGINITDENTVSVHSIPKFLMDKHEKDMKNKRNTSLVTILQTLIDDIVKELTETRGAASMFPNVMRNAFCSEACRRAIKFNKILTVESMKEMINKLKGCKTPFQCAHGRPSVIPIIDLEDFSSEENDSDDIDVRKLVKFVRQRSIQDDDLENSGKTD